MRGPWQHGEKINGGGKEQAGEQRLHREREIRGGGCRGEMAEC